MTYENLTDAETEARALKLIDAHGIPDLNARSWAQYEDTVRAYAASGSLPGERDEPPSSFYKARAAFIAISLRTLDHWMRGGEIGVQRVRGAVRTLEMYPPKEPDTPPAKSSGRTGRQRRLPANTKARTAAWLERAFPDWRDRLFTSARRLGRCVDAIAVCLALGCRPHELAEGVRVGLDGPVLVIRFAGSKVNERRRTGQPQATVYIESDGTDPVVPYLARSVLSGEIMVRCDADRLRYGLKCAARDAFGDAGTGVTPYVIRHLVAASLSDGDAVVRAITLGHASTRTFRTYGRGCKGQGPKVLDAEGDRPVRNPDRSPDFDSEPAPDMEVPQPGYAP
jgi:integrase